MTQENKELLLKDLSARLPYGVKIELMPILRGKCTTLTPIILRDYFISDDVNYLPYLRPISSMTDEEMDQLFDILRIDKDGNDEDWIKINDVLGIKFFFPTGKWVEDVAEAYDYLNSIHINYRLPKHLFIEVTNENNPYQSI